MTFDEFLSQSFSGLAGYARLLVRDRFEADDLLAESLLIAQQRWSRPPAIEHPLAYVRRIITTQHLGRRRSWFARHVDVRPAEQVPERTERDAVAAVDTRASIEFYLASLPPRQRAAVILRYYVDLSFEEIGVELGVQPSSARTLVSRGIAGMRATGLMDEHLQEMR